MSLPLGLCLLLSFSLVQAQGSTSTSITQRSQYTPSPDGGNAALPPVSYTFEYTVTTATTAWRAPAFQTASASVASCSDTICPDLDRKTCKDEMGTLYGILCDTRFIGNIITVSGKHKRDDEGRDLEEAVLLGEREADVSLEDREIDARTFTGTFEGCADACDMVDGCLGMSFNAGFKGNCQSLSSIEGSFEAVGEVAAVKQ